MSDFFSMGGYGFYVWTSYAIVFVSLCAFYVHSKKSHKKMLTLLKKKHEAKN